ncbi:hypothetical protein OG521_39620 (plasmid) [Streptomyces sp. NBC_01463]
MGRFITMPSEWVLPPGPVRGFTQALYDWYKAAGRPSLTEIADDIASHDALRGSASRETIRKMLRGETVPQRWTTVEAVLTVLCERDGTSPQGEPEYSEVTHGQRVKRLWDEAVEAAHQAREPIMPNPWAQKDEAGSGESTRPVTVAEAEAQAAIEDAEMAHAADTGQVSAVATEGGDRRGLAQQSRGSGLGAWPTASSGQAGRGGWPTAPGVPAHAWRTNGSDPLQEPERNDPFQDWQPGTEWAEAVEKSQYPSEPPF